MKPRRTISGYILLVGIMTLSIVGGVIAFQIYSALTKTQVSTQQSLLIKSLDGSIDTKVFQNLKERIVFTSSELNTVVTPTPAASTIKSASESATIQ